MLELNANRYCMGEGTANVGRQSTGASADKYKRERQLNSNWSTNLVGEHITSLYNHYNWCADGLSASILLFSCRLNSTSVNMAIDQTH